MPLVSLPGRRSALATTGAAGGLALLLFAAGSVAGAGTFAESDDAGSMPASAAVVDGAVVSVAGSLDVGDDVDMFRVCVGDGGFLASTDNEARAFDTKLDLFDESGFGVWSNDDHFDEFGRRSRGSQIADADLPAGIYHLAVTHSRQFPVDGGDRPLFAGWFGEQAAAVPGGGPLDHWGYAWALPGGAYRIDFAGVTDCSTGPVAVGVDVHPGTDVNTVAVGSRGLLPVVVLGGADVDVSTIDVATVRMGDATPAHRNGHVADFDGDGNADLLVHFRIQDTGLGLDATQACLEATTTDGTVIAGCDTITVR